MVSGRLQEKKGDFYMVLSYLDEYGRHKTKWVPTELPTKGNKRKRQKEYRQLCGNSYSKKYLEYIYVDEPGERMSPDYITAAFPQMPKKFGLRKIRVHDTRHNCASLLLANDLPMKQIQECLGHSDFSTTANVYAHLDYNSKISSAAALVTGLSLE